jgi:non-ribosomal peptide synthetase component F
VVFGTTVSGRPAELPGAETMVGMFINTVPTRVTVDAGQALGPWLRDLQARQTGSRRFDFVSLPQLRSWSDLPAGTGLFDSVVVFENYPVDASAAAAHGIEVREGRGTEATSFPLGLSAHLHERLRLSLSYDPALFDAATVSAWSPTCR